MSPRVLVTRAREDSLPFADGLVAAGAEPVFVPLVAREWVSESTAPLRRALVTAEVVLLTSAASAEAVARVWREPVRRPRIAAVGPATAARAESLGLIVDVVATRSTGAQLVADLGALDGVPLLYPRAEIATSETAEALGSSGARVTEIVAYRNVEPPGADRDLLKAGPVDLVTLFSSSAARRYGRACARVGLNPAPAIAIGPTTAQTAEREGLQVVATASMHTTDGVLHAVCEWLRRSCQPSRS